ncbi:unannotated protein [freshwater metagenome]|uniref:Unannotated protein n=1 Tax=freshwater metagenome TaxID=449393 RepID=A0A6J6SGM5_9ZZZZ
MVAAIAVGLAVGVPALTRDDPAPSGLGAVVAYEDLPTTHVDGDQDYPQSPAVGGPHANAWLECGRYDVPLREENVVHDLEHGTVWIAYDPDLAADDVDRLAELLPDNGILAPYPDLAAPVVVTVWERQLALESADDARLSEFIAAYGAGETAPEPFASCAGGLTDPQGGVDSGSDSGSGEVQV